MFCFLKCRDPADPVALCLKAGSTETCGLLATKRSFLEQTRRHFNGDTRRRQDSSLRFTAAAGSQTESGDCRVTSHRAKVTLPRELRCECATVLAIKCFCFFSCKSQEKKLPIFTPNVSNLYIMSSKVIYFEIYHVCAIMCKYLPVCLCTTTGLDFADIHLIHCYLWLLKASKLLFIVGNYTNEHLPSFTRQE